jgi:hypothetical protein
METLRKMEDWCRKHQTNKYVPWFWAAYAYGVVFNFFFFPLAGLIGIPVGLFVYWAVDRIRNRNYDGSYYGLHREQA